MNPQQETRALHFESLLAPSAQGLAGHGRRWLDAQRICARQQFMRARLPSRKDETWRYTSLDALLDTTWTRRHEATLADIDIRPTLLVDAPVARLVFVDGRWNSRLSELRMADGRVRISSLRNALDDPSDPVARWLGTTLPPTAAETSAPASFAALNTALLEDGAWIHVGAGVHAEGQIELLYLCTAHPTEKQDSAPAVLPRNLIVLEDGAAATVVEHYAGVQDGTYLTNAVTEIHLGADARLEHARLQDESGAARHLSHVYLRQGHASHYRGCHVSVGGTWSRTEFHNRMETEQAEFTLDGLYIAGDRQLTDVHLDVDHAVPHCASRERFKGILLGRGRAVFDGRVRVQPDAQKTDAHLANDNLLLSRDAEIDTKPQLEIYADDVKCTHGTTIGQLEPSQLFYLRARGIDDASARRMLCVGFAMDVLESCSVDGLRARVEQRLAERLSAITAVMDAR